MRRFSILIVVALSALACAETEPTKPGQARNCEELIKIGRNSAELVLDQIDEKEFEEMQEEEVKAVINLIDDLSQKEKFLTRSEELNCSEQELEKAACLAYQGLSQKARGDITREYLRPYFEACS